MFGLHQSVQVNSNNPRVISPYRKQNGDLGYMKNTSTHNLSQKARKYLTSLQQNNKWT